MATVLTIPQTTLPVTTRVFTTGNFAAVSNNWNLTLNLVSWPLSGDVLQLTMEASTDGVNFRPDASVDFSAPQKDRQGNTVTTVSWVTSATPNTTALRFTVNCLQTCTVSGLISAQ